MNTRALRQWRVAFSSALVAAIAGALPAATPRRPRLPGDPQSSDDPPVAFLREKSLPPIPESVRARSHRRGPSASPPTFLNPGFETAAPDGSPADWVKFREAFRDADAALAHTGGASVRSSFLMGWFQDIPVPCDPFQSFAVTGHAAREVDFEEARIRIVFSDAGGVPLSEARADSPVDGPARQAMTSPPGWGRFHATTAVPESAATARVFLAGRGSQSWIRYDDLEIATESLPPKATSPPLSLAPGTAAAWNVVSGRAGESYFVTGFATVPTAPAFGATATTLTVTESVLPRNAAADDGPKVTRSIDVSLTAGAAAWLIADVPRPSGPAAGSGLARVTLALADAGAPSARVEITSPTRGFAKVEPDTLAVGPTTPDLPLRLTAAWPGCLASANVTLLDSTGAVLAIPPVTLHGTSARTQWTPPVGTPAGPAVARFALTDSTGRTIRLDRPFTLHTETTGLTTPQPFKRPMFTRCAWVFGRYLETTASLDQAVRLAREDGFESVHMILRPDQFAAARAAAEREGLDYFVQSDEATALLRAAAARDTFSGDAYVAATRDLYAPFAGSPRWMGVYVADEPSGATLLDRCRRTFLALAQHSAAGGGLGAGFCTFPGGLPPADITATNPAIVLADIYPFHTSTPVSDSDAVLDLLPLWRAHAAASSAAGRHLWAVVQAFESPDGPEVFRAAPPAAHAAQLASVVLAGAKGVVPFTHTAISYIEGLRGPAGEATPKLAAYRAFNTLMDRIGPTVMDLAPPSEPPGVPRPWAASLARDTAGTDWLMLLNADSAATRTLAVTLTPPAPTTPAGAPRDIVTETTVPVDGAGRLVIGRGPGSWAMIALPAGTTVTAAAGTFLETLPPETPPPAAPEITLPILWQGIARASDGRRVPAAHVSLAPGGGAVAVGLDLFDTDAAPSRVFRPSGVGDASIEDPAPGVYPSDRRRFLPDGSLVSSSPYLGLRATAGTSAAAPVSARWLGHSGGARFAVRRGADWWMTAESYGLRHLSGPEGTGPDTTALTNLGLAQRDEGTAFLDIFGPTGPSADPAVLITVQDRGVDGVTSTTTAEALHGRQPLPRLDTGAALSPDTRWLAIPRHARGVTLVAIRPDLTPDLTVQPRDLNTPATDACACAWLGNDLLAVADLPGGSVWLHRIADGAPAWLVRLRKDPADASSLLTPHLRSIAADIAKTLLVAGLHDGRIMVLGTDRAVLARLSSGWDLYP